MKHFFLLILFIVSGTAFAQNWTPVRNNCNYLYYLDGHGFDTTSVTIRRDTSFLSAQDTILRLNTTVHCISASQNTYVVNQPNFLMKEIALHNDGSFTCMTPDTLVFLPHNPLNVPWLFDAANAVMAQITYEGQQLVFAAVDSVKTITLSTGDSIVLSKNHGILVYPQSGNYLHLAGLTATAEGIQTPDVASIFYTIQPGDVLEYHEQIYNADFPNTMSYTRNFWHYDSLVSKSSSGGVITLNFERRLADTMDYVVGGPSYTYDTLPWSITYSDDSTNFLNHCAGNLAVSRIELGGDYQPMYFDTNSTFSCRTISMQDIYHIGPINPAMDTVTFAYSSMYDLHYVDIYGDGVGLLYFHSSYLFGANSYSITEWLIYARIGNVSMGSMVVISGIQESPEEREQTLYPNPASANITLPSWAPVGSVVSVYSAMGALCMQTTVDDGRQMDISALAAGVYTIQFESGTTLRLVKE